MSTSTATSDALTIATTAGRVRGTERRGIRRWMGIPYAAAPVGPLRFRAPQPAPAWEGVRPAENAGPAEPQQGNPLAGGIPKDFPRSEDCLNLNVFAPDGARDLPVLVFIHGGAYRTGTGGVPIYDGTKLAQHGIVVVTINYRLGVFGSMDLRALNGDGIEFDANCTLRDQIAALQWVQHEIAAFGGDPARVTIAGESSGGNSITTLLGTPSARGLFSGAIAQSPHPQTAHAASKKAEHAHELVRRLGLDPAHAARELLRVPAPRLQTVAQQLDDDVTEATPLVAVFSPTLDGDLLPEHPMAAVRAGRASQVPLVIGTNRDESSLFAKSKIPALPTTAERAELLVKGTDEPAWERIRALYGTERPWTDAGGDGVFHVPSIEVAEAHAAHGNPVWMYRFDHASPSMRAIGLGAAHGTELPYLFGTFGSTLGRLITFTDSPRTKRRVHDVLAGSWTSFVRDGAPSHRGWEWPRYEDGDRAVLAIDTVSRVLHDPDADVRRAWSGVTYDY
jgi:para-nitrobenzyl esterase